MSFEPRAGHFQMTVVITVRRTGVVMNVAALGPEDAGSIDAICRVVLEVMRSGGCVRVCGVRREVFDLLELVGLSDVLPIEMAWQIEHREQSFGVQEEADPGDPIG
jgi:hypothetical protein